MSLPSGYPYWKEGLFLGDTCVSCSLPPAVGWETGGKSFLQQLFSVPILPDRSGTEVTPGNNQKARELSPVPGEPLRLVKTLHLLDKADNFPGMPIPMNLVTGHSRTRIGMGVCDRFGCIRCSGDNLGTNGVLERFWTGYVQNVQVFRSDTGICISRK